MRAIVREDLENILASNLPWQRFENKTVLISGANGFLPAYMVESLLLLNSKRGANVRIVAWVRDLEKARKRFSEYLKRGDLSFIVSDVAARIESNEKFDFVIHAASQASPKYYGPDPVGTLNANVLGTNNLLELARSSSSESFLFFSSGEVYGTVDDHRIPTKEDDYGYLDPTDVRSCYAESKRLGETMCVSWNRQFGIPSKIVRPFHTYGPGMDLNDGRVFADFVRNIVESKNIEMKSSGHAQRAFCYLADATIGFFTVLLQGANGMAYNVGNPDAEISILDLANRLVNLFPEKHLAVVLKENDTKGYLRSAIPRNCPDIGRMKQLGWVPTTGIDAGFLRTVSSFQ
jgi:nucleoside-diphosphate-sugar epimerase